MRSLYDDGAGKPEDVTRDYMLTLDEPFREGAAADRLWRQDHDLSPAGRGGDGEDRPLLQGRNRPGPRVRRCRAASFRRTASMPQVGAEMIGRWPFLSEPHARRLVRAYGTRIERMLGDAQSMDDLGPRFAGDLTGAEVRYLVEHEWAQTAEDVLWRRSKLGLTVDAPPSAPRIAAIHRRR